MYNYRKAIFCLLLLILAPLTFGGAVQDPPSDRIACPGTTSTLNLAYDVECDTDAATARACTVDTGTYGGWVTFNERCVSCHGDSAIASDKQVDLLGAITNGLDYDSFSFVLFHGRHGETNPMPSWQGNCAVMSDIDNLYRYLKARADGELPLGEPMERVPDLEIPTVPVAAW